MSYKRKECNDDLHNTNLEQVSRRLNILDSRKMLAKKVCVLHDNERRSNVPDIDNWRGVRDEIQSGRTDNMSAVILVDEKTSVASTDRFVTNAVDIHLFLCFFY